MPSKKRRSSAATTTVPESSTKLITVQPSSPLSSAASSTPPAFTLPARKRPRIDSGSTRKPPNKKKPKSEARCIPLSDTSLDFPTSTETIYQAPVNRATRDARPPVRMPKGSSSTAVASSSDGGSSQITRVNDQTPGKASTKDRLPSLDSDSDSEFERLCSFDALIAAFDSRRSPGAQEEPPVSPSHEKIFRPTRLPGLVEPGSACYAKSWYCFFPARFCEFIPAQTLEDQLNGDDRYVVDMITDGMKTVKRNDIIFLDDDRIAECSVGTVQTTAALTHSDADIRAASPPLTRRCPPCPSAATFAALSHTKQLRFIRPHLTEILHDRFEPGRWRAEAFFAGGTRRESLASQVRYGDIRESEIVAVLIPELERWALRGGRPAAAGAGDRPDGSETYQSLSPNLRRRYISDVLLPEAIVRLCILSSDDFPADIPVREAYDQSLNRLDDLARGSIDKDWSVIQQDLKQARRLKRRELGLRDERMTEYEVKAEEVRRGEKVEGWASGRVRKEVVTRRKEFKNQLR